MFDWRHAAVIAIAMLVPTAVLATPYVPQNDAVVLERLPEKGDAALIQLRRMRAALSASPRDIDIAVPVVRRALDAARATGDPRFLGQAQAALAPWWNVHDVPPAALLLRATIKQSQHDFDGSLADLDRLIAAHPTLAQARLTRATVLGVVGRYADARRDCAQLKGRTSPMVVAGCDATPASLSGNATVAYDALAGTLADPREPADVPRVSAGVPRESAGVREWALTLAAEIATRRGDFVAAERHFQAALALDARDAYLKGAYADFLIDRGRPREVLALLCDDTKHDALLLRLALAQQRLPDERESFAAHRDDLTARFDAARRRGDNLHRREEARFRLAIENDARTAQKLARDNWAVQREPADLRILIEAARASGDAEALKMAADWVATTRLEDAAIVAALAVRR